MYEKKYKKYSLTLLTPSKAGFMIKQGKGNLPLKIAVRIDLTFMLG